MARRSILLTMLAFVVAVAVSVEVPVSFVSSHSPHAYLIKAEVEPNAEFKVFSKKLRPSGSHWTTASSLG
jgi:multidrug efflux pump subunit AcrB